MLQMTGKTISLVVEGIQDEWVIAVFDDEREAQEYVENYYEDPGVLQVRVSTRQVFRYVAD